MGNSPYYILHDAYTLFHLEYATTIGETRLNGITKSNLFGLVAVIGVITISGIALSDATYIAVPPQAFNISAVINFDFFNIAIGNIDGWKTIDKFGRNPDVDTSFEDIWYTGGTRTLLTSASLMTVTSTLQDTSGGTGARTIFIQGLNGTYHETEETVTLNSTTPPETVNSYLRINRIIVLESGTTETNENDIVITASTGGSTQGSIEAGKGQTQMALYTIPVGYTGYFERGWVSTNSNQQVHGELLIKPEGGSWNVKRTITISSGFYEPNIVGGGAIPEKTDIKARFYGDLNNNEIMAGFSLVLKEN